MNLKPYYIHYNKPKIARILSNVNTVYTDVDGTLLGPDGSLFNTTKGRPSLYPAKALVELRQQDIDVIMISGRSRRQLFGDARILGLRDYIAELGCQIVHDLGKKVYVNAPKVKINKGNLHNMIEKSKAPQLLLDNYKGHLEYHTPWSEGRECTHVFRGLIDVNEVSGFLEKNGFDWLQIIDNGIIGRRGSLKKDLVEIHAYHLLPKEAGKDSGLKRDLELRGSKKSEAIAIGDSFSDLRLASKVSALFLVANAFSEHSDELYEEMQETENVFITPLSMNLGFAQVAFELLKARPEIDS